MRVLLLTGLVAACATGAGVPPPERVLGCWASSDGATRMNWAAPNPENPSSLRGSWSGGGVQRSFTLERSGAGYSFCEIESGDSASGRCFEVARGRQGALENGRAFIDQAGGRLRLSIAGDGPERVIFVGRRSAC